MNLIYIKLYLRIDKDFMDDDPLIEDFILSAKDFIREKTGKAFTVETNLFNQTVKFLVAHWYETRNVVDTAGKTAEVPYTVKELLSHLTLCD